MHPHHMGKRAENRVGQHFYVDEDVAEMLKALSDASRRSKTQVVEFLVREEHEKRKQSGQLGVSQGLFPEPQPSPKAKKRKKVKE
jgi:hypothetical protein